MDNKIICNHCNHEIIRSRYFNHLETYHYDEYLKTVDKIIKMNNEGYTIFEIAKKHNTTSKKGNMALDYKRIQKR